MADTHVILSLARIATAALAGTIAVLGFRAYAQTRRRHLRAMASGAGLLAAGYFAEGVLVEVAGWSLHHATVLESVTTLLAAALLVASLYMREVAPRPFVPPTPAGGAP